MSKLKYIGNGQAHLVDLYGHLVKGEPKATVYKTVEEIKREGLVGIYIKDDNGEGAAQRAINSIVN